MLVVRDRVDDGGDAVVLPVQTIHARYTWKRRISGALRCVAGLLKHHW
jgi:hypothetical protein